MIIILSRPLSRYQTNGSMVTLATIIIYADHLPAWLSLSHAVGVSNKLKRHAGVGLACETMWLGGDLYYSGFLQFSYFPLGSSGPCSVDHKLIMITTQRGSCVSYQ